jgi:hypothetical protein
LCSEVDKPGGWSYVLEGYSKLFTVEDLGQIAAGETVT